MSLEVQLDDLEERVRELVNRIETLWVRTLLEDEWDAAPGEVHYFDPEH